MVGGVRFDGYGRELGVAVGDSPDVTRIAQLGLAAAHSAVRDLDEEARPTVLPLLDSLRAHAAAVAQDERFVSAWRDAPAPMRHHVLVAVAELAAAGLAGRPGAAAVTESVRVLDDAAGYVLDTRGGTVHG
jgi:hypothetical protein